MDKNEFKEFCNKEFAKRGFKSVKSMYYLAGKDLLCGIQLQKSNFGAVYYVNYYFFLGNFSDIRVYPSHYESDIDQRFLVMSKTQTVHRKHFVTAQIEYEEYTEEELRPYFDKEFEERILPPVYKGKRYILDHLERLYFVYLNKEEVIKKLQS